MKNAGCQHVWKAEEYHKHSSVQSIAAFELIEQIRLNGTEKILDVGCGDGKITATLAKKASLGSVVGIDISPEMIHFASSVFTDNQYPNLTFFLQDAQKLEYREEFDLIFSSFAIQWVSNLDAFFQGSYQSLKTSGYLAVTVPLGISSALEEALDIIMAQPQWSHYFQSTHKFVFFTEQEYLSSLNVSRLNTCYSAVIFQEVLFPSRSLFEKYVLSWLSYLQLLPENLKQDFFQNVIDQYLKIEPSLKTGEIRFIFPRLDLLATKP